MNQLAFSYEAGQLREVVHRPLPTPYPSVCCPLCLSPCVTVINLFAHKFNVSFNPLGRVNEQTTQVSPQWEERTTPLCSLWHTGHHHLLQETRVFNSIIGYWPAKSPFQILSHGCFSQLLSQLPPHTSSQALFSRLLQQFLSNALLLNFFSPPWCKLAMWTSCAILHLHVLECSQSLHAVLGRRLMSNELEWHEESLCMDSLTWLNSTVTGFVSGASGACLHWGGGLEVGRKGQHTKYMMTSLRK